MDFTIHVNVIRRLPAIWPLNNKMWPAVLMASSQWKKWKEIAGIDFKPLCLADRYANFNIQNGCYANQIDMVRVGCIYRGASQHPGKINLIAPVYNMRVSFTHTDTQTDTHPIVHFSFSFS